MDWRPHHEHVGQTGVAIRPNCYIAIGISGAIQHLAGVNQSKVIAVIDKGSRGAVLQGRRLWHRGRRLRGAAEADRGRQRS